MTVDEQMKIISSYKQGIPVYMKERYSYSEKWKLILGDHVFDFVNNCCSIDQPKTWIETLCEEPDANVALKKAVEHLNNSGHFVIEITAHGGAILLEDIYKLWNIAVEYGRNGFATEQITEENNIFRER